MNGYIYSPERTSPTSDCPPYDCYAEHKIGERMDDVRSASYSPGLNETCSYETLSRLSDKFEHVKGELAIRTQELEAQTLLKHRCMKKLQAIRQKMISLQAENKSFRRTIRNLTRELRELGEPKAKQSTTSVTRLSLFMNLNMPIEPVEQTCPPVSDQQRNSNASGFLPNNSKCNHLPKKQSMLVIALNGRFGRMCKISMKLCGRSGRDLSLWTQLARWLPNACSVLELLCLENFTSQLRACALRS